MVDTSDKNGHPFPSSATVEACVITTASGKQYDLKHNIVELSYYEDLYGFCVSGYVMLRDGIGLLEGFSISGGETIEIMFSDGINPVHYNLKRDFMIYKVGDRNPTGNMNSEFYKLYFCTKDLLVNEQTKVSKSYKGKKINQIVEDILVNFLKTKRNIRIDETLGVNDFVIPMKKPYEAISWLCNYAIPNKGNGTGPSSADMFFFEDLYGYKMASLKSLMEDDYYDRDYKYQQNNLSDESSNLNHEQHSVISIEFVRSFNLLKDISSGAFANKVIGFDPLTKTVTTHTFDYEKYSYEIGKPTNGYGINPNITTPLGLKPNQTPDTLINVVFTNSGQKDASYIKNTAASAVQPDMYTQQSLSNRTAQVALMNHTVLKILVPGDRTLTVGQTINFSYYKLGMTDKTRELDDTYSGKYLITGLRHILQSSGVFQTVLEISKNSSKKPLPNSQG